MVANTMPAATLTRTSLDDGVKAESAGMLRQLTQGRRAANGCPLAATLFAYTKKGNYGGCSSGVVVVKCGGLMRLLVQVPWSFILSPAVSPALQTARSSRPCGRRATRWQAMA